MPKPCVNQEDYAGAITAYNSARDINPKIPQIYLGRGICYRELGQFDLALNDFNNAMELDRNNPEIAANLGDLLVTRTQDPTSGIRVLDKAIELDPEGCQVVSQSRFGSRPIASLGTKPKPT